MVLLMQCVRGPDVGLGAGRPTRVRPEQSTLTATAADRRERVGRRHRRPGPGRRWPRNLPWVPDERVPQGVVPP